MAQTMEKAKGTLNQPISNDPYSNQFPMMGPSRKRKLETKHTGLGMADLDTEDANTGGRDLLVDIGAADGAGMKDGGLIGSHSGDR